MPQCGTRASARRQPSRAAGDAKGLRYGLDGAESGDLLGSGGASSGASSVFRGGRTGKSSSAGPPRDTTTRRLGGAASDDAADAADAGAWRARTTRTEPVLSGAEPRDDEGGVVVCAVFVGAVFVGGPASSSSRRPARTCAGRPTVSRGGPNIVAIFCKEVFRTISAQRGGAQRHLSSKAHTRRSNVPATRTPRVGVQLVDSSGDGVDLHQDAVRPLQRAFRDGPDRVEVRASVAF